MKRRRAFFNQVPTPPDAPSDVDPPPRSSHDHTAQPPPKRRRTVPSPHFQELCRLLEELSVTRGQARKTTLFRAWLRRFDKAPHFSFMRLLCPEADMNRSPYGMKESQLARVLCRIMGLTNVDETSYAYRLKNWKGSSRRGASSGNQFSDVVVAVLRERGFREKSTDRSEMWTLADVNVFLDKLSSCRKTDRDFQQAFSIIAGGKLSVLEWKWLVRIILKALHCGCSTLTFYRIYHPSMEDLMAMHFDLEASCLVVEKNGPFPTGHVATVGRACRPMLAQDTNENLGRKNSYARGRRKQIVMGKVARVLREGSWVTETKFDGERILIHYQRGRGTDRVDPKISYFTRKGIDYTHHHDELFNKIVIDALHDFESCIVDGEMLVYDEKLQEDASGQNFEGGFVKFGMNRTYSAERPEHMHYCFMCFDVLCYNGNSVLALTYLKRKQILERHVHPQDNFFEVVPGIAVQSLEDVRNQVDIAVKAGNEGVILKEVSSKYTLGKRSNQWMKAKPQYHQTFDLLILGGFYGTKFQSNSISHFLLGVARDQNQVDRVKAAEMSLQRAQQELQELRNRINPARTIEMDFASVRQRQRSDGLDADDDPEILQKKNEVGRFQHEFQQAKNSVEFVPIVKVGSGYNRDQLQALQDLLRPHWQPFDKNRIPRYLERSGWIPKDMKHTPNYSILPEHSVVLTIKAQEMVASDKYPGNQTLRFCRVDQIRSDDKSWYEVMTKKQFEDLRFQEQKTVDGMGYGPDDPDEFDAARLAARREVVTVPLFQDTETDDLVVERNLFQMLVPIVELSEWDDEEDDLSNFMLVRKARRAGLRRVAFPNVTMENDSTDFHLPPLGEEDEEEEGVSYKRRPIVFHILDEGTRSHPKPRLEEMIVMCGGAKTQNRDKADLLLASRQTIQTQSILRRNRNPLKRQLDVLKFDWVLECARGEGSTLLPIEKRHVFRGRALSTDENPRAIVDYISDEMKKWFHHQMDEFGDKYTEDVSVADLRRIFLRMSSRPREVESEELGDERLFNLRKYFREHPRMPLVNSTVMLQDCVIYFDIFDLGPFTDGEEGEEARRRVVQRLRRLNRCSDSLLFGVSTLRMNSLDELHETFRAETRRIELKAASYIAQGLGATVVETLADPRLTHVIVANDFATEQELDVERLSLMQTVRDRAGITAPPGQKVTVVRESWIDSCRTAGRLIVPSAMSLLDKIAELM